MHINRYTPKKDEQIGVNIFGTANWCILEWLFFISMNFIISDLSLQVIITGEVDQSVYDRGLVTEHVKWKDIVENHASYYQDTQQRAVQHMTLAYVTPVSSCHSTHHYMYGITTCINDYLNT